MLLRDHDHEDEDDEWGDDPEDDETTLPCPACREPVYDDADVCPYCGADLSRCGASARKPWWVVLGVLACLMMVTWWILHP